MIKGVSNEEFDFHLKYEKEIRQSDNMSNVSMLILKNEEKIIKRFTKQKSLVSERKKESEHVFEVISFRIISITIKISLLNRDNKFLELKSFPDGNIKVSASIFCDSKDIALLIKNEIEKHRLGFEHEQLFETVFLEKLKFDYPTLIVFANRASKHSDRKRGIDFLVGYKPPGQDNVFTVSFNLKSSHAYIKKHKERYPSVSTYIFYKEMLDDYKKMKNFFFRFLDIFIPLL